MSVDLRQGDCLELLRAVPDNSIDLAVTSPPYDNIRSYNGNITQWSFEKFQGIAKELYRTTVLGGSSFGLSTMLPSTEAKQEPVSGRRCTSKNAGLICTIL